MNHLPPLTQSNIFEMYPNCFGSYIFTEESFLSYENNIIFIYSLREYLACFSLFTITNNTVMNFLVAPGTRARISEAAGLKLFSQVVTPIYTPTTNVWECLFCHILFTLGFVRLANFCQYDGYTIVFYHGFNFHFPSWSGTSLLAICFFFCEELFCIVYSFCNWAICLFLTDL